MSKEEGIKRPFMNGYCEKCRYHYLLDGDESRCHKIKPFGGFCSAMCAAVAVCRSYEEKGRKENV